MTGFVTNLKNYVEEKIKIKENEQKINNLKILIKEYEEVKNYYVSLNIDIETIENLPKERYNVINRIYSEVNNEYTANQTFYINEKEKMIKTILTSLQELRKEISKETNQIDSENKLLMLLLQYLIILMKK